MFNSCYLFFQVVLKVVQLTHNGEFFKILHPTYNFNTNIPCLVSGKLGTRYYSHQKIYIYEAKTSCHYHYMLSSWCVYGKTMLLLNCEPFQLFVCCNRLDD